MLKCSELCGSRQSHWPLSPLQVYRVVSMTEFCSNTSRRLGSAVVGCELDGAQVEREVTEYARQVLDAMGIENGPGHMEVRPHGETAYRWFFCCGFWSRARTKVGQHL